MSSKPRRLQVFHLSLRKSFISINLIQSQHKKPAIVRQGEYVSSEIENRLQERGVTLDGIIAAMQQFTVETPSWGYGDSGTRFKVFHWPGAASNLREKLADAAQVQKV